MTVVENRSATADPVTLPEPPATVHPKGRPHVLELRCHRRLRGPYSGGSALLRAIVPELGAVAPELAAASSTAVVAIAPDLQGRVPDRPATLTDLADGSERTRFYAVARTRDLAYMVSELVNAWARTCHPEGVLLRFAELAEADVTDRQLVDMLRRRGAAAGVAVETPDRPEIAVLPADAAQAWIDSDGTLPEPHVHAAYQALPAQERARRHADRAQRLVGTPGAELGAIPWHLERSEQRDQALLCLVEAQNRTFREGFYEAALDLGRRGRALLTHDQDPGTHDYLTKRVIGALTYLGRCDEAITVIDEHRRATTRISEQMNSAYMMAMIYTRHLERDRIDHEKALAWVNTALSLAEGEPDAHKHAFFGAFMRNAKALVELHRGDLQASLELVEQAIAIADEHLGAAEHALHRTVLINNRARVLLALGRHDEAMDEFGEVIRRDPEYDEPYFERATAHRTCCDAQAALADLERAVALSVAFTDAHYNRADLLLELGDEDAARAALESALDIDPVFVPALLTRASLRLGDGDLDGAEQDLSLGLTADDRNAALWSAFGTVRAEQGRADEAMSAFATALDLDDSLVTALANRAVLAFELGHVAQAVADLDRALELEPSGELHLNRAVGRQHLGDLDGALDDVRAAHRAGVDDAALAGLRAAITAARATSGGAG